MFCEAEDSVDGDSNSGYDGEASSHFVEDTEVAFSRNLEENMYGAVVYVWARRITGKGCFKYNQVIVTTLLFFFTIYLQVVFGWYMIPQVSVNELEEKVVAVNQFKHWRENTTDERADFTCTGKVFSYVEDFADELVKYNTPRNLFYMIPVTQGVMFGVLAMMLWSCLLVIQMRAALASLALFNLDDPAIDKAKHKAKCQKKHRDAHTRMEWNIWKEVEQDEGQEFKNGWAKLVIVSTFFLRTVATAGFGYYGMAFLAYTDNLRDFILNCVALAFVFEIPDIIYRAFSLIETQQELQDLNAAFSKVDLNMTMGHAVVLGQFFFLLLVGAGPFVYGVHRLMDFSDMYANEVFRQLCATVPGNTSQVFE